MSGAVQSHGSSAALEYPLTPAWDEGFDADGAPRPLYAAVLEALSATDLSALREAVASQMRGVVFGGSGDTSPFCLDPVPRLIDADEWDLLARGLAQRTRALWAFLADAYGERAIVADGRVPERVIESAELFEPEMRGAAPPTTGCVAGLDLVRGGDGVLRVLEDNMRTPSGIAYMAAGRTALDSLRPWPRPPGRDDPGQAFDMLAAALRESAPDGGGDPSIALLSDGPANSAWWEHREIAGRLGVPIVLPTDLLVREGRLHARVEGGRMRELQVVYRRTDEDRLHDDEGKATWLAEMLMGPSHRGVLTVVNPLGAGLADDKLVHAYVEEMVRFYLGEEPLVPSVRTFDLGDEEVLEEVLPRLSELVVKPRAGHGGAGVVVCPHATGADRQAVERLVRAQPGRWIAQEMVMLSTHPTVCGGRLEPRHVDLRPFVIGAGESAATVPGALTRVAFEAGALVVNSSRDGGGKDTWVMP